MNQCSGVIGVKVLDTIGTPFFFSSKYVRNSFLYSFCFQKRLPGVFGWEFIQAYPRICNDLYKSPGI